MPRQNAAYLAHGSLAQLGFFATVFPMGITIDPREPAADGIAAIQRQREAPPMVARLPLEYTFHTTRVLHSTIPGYPSISRETFDTAHHSELLSDAPYMPPQGVLSPGDVRNSRSSRTHADGRLRFQLRYHVSTFHPRTVRQLSEHLQTVVATLAEELG